MKVLTLRQREVLGFIIEFKRAKTYSPTIREIGDHFEISVKGAYDHLEALKKKGFVKFVDRRSRTIEVVKTEDGSDELAAAVVKVPLLGKVAAGSPIPREENLEGFIPIHPSLLKKNVQYFALKVQGDSMINAGIADGDTAVFEKQADAENRDIVVARVDDETVTLKRFFKEPNRVRLEPANPNYPPIYTQDVEILGRLVHIIRSY
jgi:repressor LexA